MSRPTILALHGFSGTGADFDLLRHAWAADRRWPAPDWLTPDLPGHGTTPVLPSRAGEEAFAATAAWCLRTLDERPSPAGTTPTILLGYSMGGRLALDLACRCPRRFDALVLVGASPGLETESARQSRAQADQELAAAIVADGVAAFAERWEQVPIIASQRRIRAPWGDALRARRRGQRPEGLAWALAALGTGVMPPRHADLATLKLPVLLVTGAEDTRFEAIARDMLAFLPDARHASLPGAGHCAHLEAPEAAAYAIASFVEATLPPACRPVGGCPGK